MAADQTGGLSGLEELPLNPSRDNYAYGCVHTDEHVQGREHLHRCECDPHHGVCQACGYKITVGPSGTEYGHARARNRVASADDDRRDCQHRPTSCNTGQARAQRNSDDAGADDGGASA